MVPHPYGETSQKYLVHHLIAQQLNPFYSAVVIRYRVPRQDVAQETEEWAEAAALTSVAHSAHFFCFLCDILSSHPVVFDTVVTDAATYCPLPPQACPL